MREFRRGRLAYHDCAGAPQRSDDVRVPIGNTMFMRKGPERCSVTGRWRRVLERHRHAVEWTQRRAADDGVGR